MKKKRRLFDCKLLLAKIYSVFLNFIGCKKRVLFISFAGKQYSDNPRAISEYLHKVNPKTKQVWMFENPDKMREVVPSYIKCVKFNNVNLLKYYKTSRVIIDNDCIVYKHFLTYFPKNKKQLFIQTWHGDRGLKRCFYDVDGFSPQAPFTLEQDGFWDYLLTGSTFAEGVVRTMFRYRGKLLTCGYPRNDCLINSDKESIRKVKEKLDITEDTRILLYAPTFKGKIGDKMTEHINFKELINLLEKKTNQQWVVVYRPHHIGKDTEIPSCTRFFYANRLFEDMAEILQATDMLITDYSSCAGDFILTNKPVILYINDYEEYKNSDRGLHFKIEDSPFLFAKDNNQLKAIVSNLNESDTIQNCEQLKKFYGCTESGRATEIIVSKILKNLYPSKRKKND